MSIIRKYIMLSLLLVVDIGADRTERKSSLNDEVICHFIPSTKSGSWDKAMEVCSSFNTSLPIIRNKKEEEALSQYLRHQSIIALVWTAGKQEEKSNWTWINGQNLINKEVIETTSNTDDNLTAAVLTEDLKYKAQDPQHPAYYLCQSEAKENGFWEKVKYVSKKIFGWRPWKTEDQSKKQDISCDNENNGFIKIHKGCLGVISRNESSWNEALNDCLERGEHLPVLDDNDLKMLQESRIWRGYNRSIWLGLMKISWTWSSNDTYGIIGQDHPERNGSHCIAFNASNGNFVPANCTNDFDFVCEKRVTMSTQTSCQYSSSTIKSTTNSLSHTSSDAATQQALGSRIAVAVVVGLICIIIIVVIAIMVTRRKSSNIKTENPESAARIDQHLVPANKEGASAKQQGSNNGVYVDIPLATKSSTEDAYSEITHPGIVYTSVDFENAPKNSNQAPANKTHPQGDIYAEVIKSESDSK